MKSNRKSSPLLQNPEGFCPFIRIEWLTILPMIQNWRDTSSVRVWRHEPSFGESHDFLRGIEHLVAMFLLWKTDTVSSFCFEHNVCFRRLRWCPLVHDEHALPWALPSAFTCCATVWNLPSNIFVADTTLVIVTVMWMSLVLCWGIYVWADVRSLWGLLDEDSPFRKKEINIIFTVMTDNSKPEMIKLWVFFLHSIFNGTQNAHSFWPY